MIDHIFALLLSSWLPWQNGIALCVACQQWRLFNDTSLLEDSPGDIVSFTASEASRVLQNSSQRLQLYKTNICLVRGGLKQLPEMSRDVLRYECPVEIDVCRWSLPSLRQRHANDDQEYEQHSVVSRSKSSQQRCGLSVVLQLHRPWYQLV